MSLLLDEYGLKTYIDNVVAVPQDVDQLKEYSKEMATRKRIILDGIWDHIGSDLSRKNIAKEM